LETVQARAVKRTNQVATLGVHVTRVRPFRAFVNISTVAPVACVPRTTLTSVSAVGVDAQRLVSVATRVESFVVAFVDVEAVDSVPGEAARALTGQ